MNPPPAPDPPVVIGLLGGVAAGKSFVAGIFGEFGLRVIDADAAARAVVAEPAVLARLTARFGPAIVDDSGLDRQKLADLVFDAPAARRDLEAITHPPIRQRLLDDLEAARAAGGSVVLDVPLLLEGGLIDRCDLAVFVEVDAAIRDARARGRGWDDGERARREAAQASLADKRAQCRFVVDNGQGTAVVRAQVAAILQELGSPDL